MLEFLDGVMEFSKDLLVLFLVLTFLPYFVRIIIQVVIGFIKRILKFDLNPILDMIAIPGSLIRNIPIDIYLKIKGWTVSVTYSQRVGRSVSNLSGAYAGGFSIFMRPGHKRPADFRDTIFIMLSSYSMTFLFYLWMKHANDVVKFFTAILGLNSAYFLFVMCSLSFALGGLPTSSETVLPLKFLFKDKPVVLGGIVSIFMGSVILNRYYGPTIAQVTFMLMTAITITYDRMLDTREKRFQEQYMFPI